MSKNKFRKWLKKARKKARELGVEFNETIETINPFDTDKSEVIFPKEFKVKIAATAYKKLFSYVRSTDLEVSGLGLVKKTTTGFRIYDIFVLNQESTGGHTDLDPNAMAKLMCKLIKERGRESVNDLKFWWHSHPHFGTFWSGTDDATADRLSNDKFLVAWVVNHDYSIRCRIELKQPFRMTLDNVPIEIEGGKHRKIEERFSSEARKKVKDSSPVMRGFGDYVGLAAYGYEYVYDKDLKSYVWQRKEAVKPAKDNSQIVLPLLLGAKEETGKKKSAKELTGNTLYVNSITKKSSFNKDEVKCKECKRDSCGGCETFTKLMHREVGEYVH